MKKICVICGKEFEGRAMKYCSPDCEKVGADKAKQKFKENNPDKVYATQERQSNKQLVVTVRLDREDVETLVSIIKERTGYCLSVTRCIEIILVQYLKSNRKQLEG